tara:strand:+ start:35 stop:547 length:513 start_codon:yes stop_codon:yes gene_type:complete
MLHPYIDIKRERLINAFIGDENFPEYDNHIFLLYKFSGSKNFLTYENSLEKNDLFVKSYDPDKEHVMYIFKVPSFYKHDYSKYREGKYSKMSYDYKVVIFDFHKIYDHDHKVAKVLFKHPDLKEELEDRIDAELPKGAEVSSVPDLGTEIYMNSMKVKEPVKPNLKPFEE